MYVLSMSLWAVCDGQQLTQDNAVELLHSGSVVSRVKAARGESSKESASSHSTASARERELGPLRNPRDRRKAGVTKSASTLQDGGKLNIGFPVRQGHGPAIGEEAPCSSRSAHEGISPPPALFSHRSREPEIWLASKSNRKNVKQVAFNSEQQLAAHAHRLKPLFSEQPTVVPSATDVSLAEFGMENYEHEALAKEDLTEWLSSYKDESAAFNSMALHAEMRLEEVINNTQSLGNPNVVRTRVVAQLLDAIVMKFGRFQRITT
eukprot:gene23081-27930_t